MKPVSLLLTVPFFLVGCHSPEHFRARYWVTPKIETALAQQEAETAARAALVPPGDLAAAQAGQTDFVAKPLTYNDFPESKLAGLDEKDNVGLAFSGGGNRAALCALGQVRALETLGLMDRVRYISAVSGGAWFSVPYTFQRGDTKTFLGSYQEPKGLTLAQMHAVPVKGTFAKCAHDARTAVVPTMMSRHGDENFAHRLNKIYLDDFGPLGDERRFFCHDEATLKDILNRNQNVTRDDFNVAAPGRPYLIASTVLDIMGKTRADKFTPVEITANYTGAAPVKKSKFSKFLIGGGYVESFGYDSKFMGLEESAGENLAKVRLPMRWGLGVRSAARFSLSDMMAASGAAPSVPMPWVSFLVGFPQFLHWSPAAVQASETTGAPVKTKEKIHTDGGGIDNAGVIPLLRRRVGTIIAFVNAETNFDKKNDPIFPSYVGALFGEKQSKFSSQKCQVFEASGYAALKDDYERAWKSNEPLTFKRNYKTEKNEGYGIEGGRDVQVVWVFLGGSKDAAMDGSAAGAGSVRRWIHDMVDIGVKSLIASEEFARFPYYRTFFETGPFIIALPPRKVNALAHFTSYNVMAQKDLFRQSFNTAGRR